MARSHSKDDQTNPELEAPRAASEDRSPRGSVAPPADRANMLAEPTTYKQVIPRAPPLPASASRTLATGTDREPPLVDSKTAEPTVVVTRVIELNDPSPKSRGAKLPAPAPATDLGPRSPAAPAIKRPSKTPTAPMLQLDPLPPNAAAIPRGRAPAAHGSPQNSPPTSRRPSAPEIAPPESRASIADTFERLLSDVDAGFDDLERQTERMVNSLRSPALASVDLAEVRELFGQLAANHMRQVRDFMIDVRWGDATLEWVAICGPAVRSLRSAAEKLEFAELREALDAFAGALADAQAKCARTIEGEPRDAILARYEALSAILPQAFALDMDRSQREAAILQSLLLQVPDVKKITIDKLYAAGLTTLEAMFLARVDDVVAATAIAPAVAEGIVSRFRAYHEQIRASSPDATRSRERARIAELLSQLKREHDEYERASEGWSKEAGARKKELRQSRTQTLLDIHVLLARLGEVDTLRELERLPFERKLDHLATFLEDVREKYAAQP